MDKRRQEKERETHGKKSIVRDGLLFSGHMVHSNFVNLWLSSRDETDFGVKIICFVVLVETKEENLNSYYSSLSFDDLNQSRHNLLNSKLANLFCVYILSKI
jgi:hypothetical protein